MAAYVKVRYEERARGRIAFVTVDNPERRNCLSSAVMGQFTDLFHGLAADLLLRAVVLTGAGDKAFIGGADIEEMSRISSASEARAFVMRLHGCCQAIRRTPAPVIAAINGWCLGAGLEVAAACDLRLCADTARFGMPAVKLGIPAPMDAALLPSLIGWGRARRILLTGETFTAVQAAAWGLVEECHPPGLLYAAVEDLLDRLLEAEPRALQLQKALMQGWEDMPLAQAVASGAEAFEEAWTTDEPSGAMARFLETRGSRPKT